MTRTLLRNGVVHTGTGDPVTALAVEDGRVAWLGDDDARRRRTTAPTRSSTSGAGWSPRRSSTRTSTSCRPAVSSTGST